MITLDGLRSLSSSALKVGGGASLTFMEVKNKVIEEIRKQQLNVSIAEEDFKSITSGVVSDFVMIHKPRVDGFIKDDLLMVDNLKKALYEGITGWGKLTTCRDNPAIREIQINGKAIFVDGKKGYSLLRDPDTKKPITFDNPDEATEFISMLLIYSGERLQKDTTQVNARTIEGFRVAATHPGINPPHELTPTEKWPTAVIRKPGGNFDRNDLIEYGTAVEEMVVFTEAMAECRIGIVVVGTTGCGKSTTLGIATLAVKDETRLLSIQKPTEIMNYKLVDGVPVNNVVYWEASDKADDSNPNSPTTDHLVDHSLRYTADMLLLGEMRIDREFSSGIRAANTGTDFFSTYHSNGIEEALDRMAIELQGSRGIDMMTAKELAAKYLTIIIYQDRLDDGTRKQLNIAEVEGFDRNKNEYIYRHLYSFEPTSIGYNSDGDMRILGEFRKHKNISAQLKRRLLFRGCDAESAGDFYYDIRVDGNDPITGDYQVLKNVTL